MNCRPHGPPNSSQILLINKHLRRDVVADSKVQNVAHRGEPPTTRWMRRKEGAQTSFWKPYRPHGLLSVAMGKAWT